MGQLRCSLAGAGGHRKGHESHQGPQNAQRPVTLMTSRAWMAMVSGSIFLSLLAAGEAAQGTADTAFAVHQGAAAVGAAGALKEDSPAHRSFSSEHSFSQRQRITEQMFLVKGLGAEVFC